MTDTCIINQFDCNAGTSGDDVCISGGKRNVANAAINKAVGAVNAPTKEFFSPSPSPSLFCGPVSKRSKRKWKVEKLHAKKIKDSYKLLNGKCPDSFQRSKSKLKRQKFASIINIRPNFHFFTRKESSIQYEIIEKNNKRKEEFPKKFSISRMFILLHFFVSKKVFFLFFTSSFRSAPGSTSFRTVNVHKWKVRKLSKTLKESFHFETYGRYHIFCFWKDLLFLWKLHTNIVCCREEISKRKNRRVSRNFSHQKSECSPCFCISPHPIFFWVFFFQEKEFLEIFSMQIFEHFQNLWKQILKGSELSDGKRNFFSRKKSLSQKVETFFSRPEKTKNSIFQPKKFEIFKLHFLSNFKSFLLFSNLTDISPNKFPSGIWRRVRRTRFSLKTFPFVQNQCSFFFQKKSKNTSSLDFSRWRTWKIF